LSAGRGEKVSDLCLFSNEDLWGNDVQF
jgi:hypothetical protein